MSKRERKEPPLKSMVELTYSKDEGDLIVTHQSRGFLVDIHVKEAKRGSRKLLMIEGREPLKFIASKLRAILIAADLPTDRSPILPKELDSGFDEPEHEIVPDEDLWFEFVEESTEPLSKTRIAGELLHAINRLLSGYTDSQLKNIFRAMRLYHFYCSDELQEAALSAEASKKGREKGPSVKRERARALRALILDIAERFWRNRPNLKGQPDNTAKKITLAVNEAMMAQKLGRKPLAEKTVADHLRVALRAKS